MAKSSKKVVNLAGTVRKGEAVPAGGASPRSASQNTAALNFTVSPNLKKRYKLAAAMAETKQVKILEESFELWLAQHPEINV